MTTQSIRTISPVASLVSEGGVRKVGRLLIVPVVLLVVWHFLAKIIGGHAMATPGETLTAVLSGFQQGWLQADMIITLQSTVYAALLAGGAGLLGGLFLGRNPYWRAVFEQPAVWVYSVPKIVLYPVLVLMLGLGAKSNIAFAILQGFFPVLLIMSAVIADVPDVYVKMSRVYRLSPLRFLLRVVVPYSLPSLALSFRYCFSLCYIGIVVAEMFAAESGIGFALIKSITLGQIPRMFAIVVVITGFALVVNFTLLALERWLSVPSSADTAVDEQ